MSYSYVSDGEATPLFNSSAARDRNMGEFPWGIPADSAGIARGWKPILQAAPEIATTKNHAGFPQNEYACHSRPDAPGGLVSDKGTRASMGLEAGFLLAHSGNG